MKNNNKNNNDSRKHILPIVLSLSIGLCAIGAGVGGTIAYFTSEQNTNLKVKTGKVNLTGSIDNTSFRYYSDDVEQENGFALGGTASLTSTDGSLSVTSMCPGDKLTFDLVLHNSSSVKINYRVSLSKEDGSDVAPFVLEGGEEASLAVSETEKTLPLAISFPASSEGDDLMDITVDFLIKIQAIQGNESVDKIK